MSFYPPFTILACFFWIARVLSAAETLVSSRTMILVNSVQRIFGHREGPGWLEEQQQQPERVSSLKLKPLFLEYVFSEFVT